LRRDPVSGPVRLADAALLEFWTERHLCTLTTLRADGSPHVVAVGATLDPAAGLARVITSGASAKVRHVRAGADRVAICQVDGARWSTVEGRAVIRDDPAAVAEAERRYAARYRPPRPNPRRVVIEVTVTGVLGSSRLTGS
jgi:PPOX class probable F420-dependent enzyme